MGGLDLVLALATCSLISVASANEYEKSEACPYPYVRGATTDSFYATYSEGSTVKITCLGEKILQGGDSLECTAEGQWNIPLPTCEDKLPGIQYESVTTACPRRSIANGQASPDNTAYILYSTVTFECYPGHELIGQATSECLSGGVWSTSTPVCRATAPAGCLQPKFAHGTFNPVLSGGRRYHQVGTKMTFRCLGEYRMQGSQYATCTSNGRWTRLPECIDGCRKQTIRDGRLFPSPAKRGEYYDFGSVVTVTCNPGFLVAGPVNATCLSSGIWNRLLVCTDGCVEPSVPHLTTLPRPISGANLYKVDAIVKFKCAKGFLLQGPRSSQCLSGNKWSKKMPTCSGTISFCKYPDELKMGSFRPVQKQYGVGEKITWTCHNNHLLVGATVSFCTSEGVFKPPKPICKPTQERIDYKPGQAGSYDVRRRGCTRPGLSVGGIIRPKKEVYRLGNEVQFSCRIGYKMVGSARAICQDYGFTFGAPACSLVQCIPPSLPQNGQFVDAAKDHYYYGDKVTYMCDQNHIMSGGKHTTCNEDGKFFPGPPECMAPSCRFHCKYVKGRNCQCHIGCRYLRNCCTDFEQFCRKLYY